jgi:hypothetical protein
MPVIRVVVRKGLSGYKYGVGGHVYTYSTGDVKARAAAYAKAVRRGQAIRASEARGGKKR